MRACRVGGVLAVIDTIPSGFGPDMLCGELRTDDDQPYRFPSRPGASNADDSGLMVAPNTERGLALLLAGLQRLVDTRPVHPVRRTG